ncbi:MAG: hypothetical protein KAR79_00005, partial [Simkaniaceae bacterium]|nr:hypothetical protein [Simkaniaceae bacterium]
IKKEARSIEDKIMLLLHESSEEHIIVRFRGDQLKIVDSLRSTSFEEFVDLNFWLLHNYPKYNSDDILTVLNLKIQDTGLLSRALMIFSQALVDQDPQNFIESQKFARAIPDEAMRMRTFGKIIEKLCKKDIQKSLDFFIPHFLELANTVSDSFQGSQLVSKVVRSLDNSRYYSNIDYLLSNYHGANKAEIEKRLKKGRTLRG